MHPTQLDPASTLDVSSVVRISVAIALGLCGLALPQLAESAPKTWPKAVPAQVAAAFVPIRAFDFIVTQAQQQSAATSGKAATKVNVRFTADAAGHLTSLLGSDLRWRPAPAKIDDENAAGMHAVGILSTSGSAFGLDSAQDTLVIDRVDVSGSGVGKVFAVRLHRLRLGLPVAAQSVLLHLTPKAEVTYLLSSLEPCSFSLKSPGMSIADLKTGGLLWWQDREQEAAGGTPVLALAHFSGDVTVIREVSSDAVLARHEHVSTSTFSTIVTARNGVPGILANQPASQGYTMPDLDCRSHPLPVANPPVVTVCADAGTPIWQSDTAQCCPHCQWSPDFCAMGCAADPLCQDPGLDVTAKVALAAAALMAQRLTAYGIDRYDATDPNVNPPLVISPSGNGFYLPCTVPGFAAGAACAAATGYNPAKCRGPVDNDHCAQAFYPKPNQVTVCTAGLGAAKGAILMGEKSKQALDVMTHEFGHLWLGGHGFAAADFNVLLGQPASVHEGVSDALALVVDDDDWLLGEATDCKEYRSACQPWCGTSPPAITIQDASCQSGPPGPATPICKVQPYEWANYTFKPAGNAAQVPHFNTGILNFASFLFGTTGLHEVKNQTIQGQGRAALASALHDYPQALNPTGPLSPISHVTYEGHREAMIAAAVPGGSALAMEAALDAVGIWRSEGTTRLYGVGKVALFEQEVAGTPTLFMVNWDGFDSLTYVSCTMSGTMCQFGLPTQVVTSPSSPAPSGPPAVLRLTPVDVGLIYPTLGGSVAFMPVANGVFGVASYLPSPLPDTSIAWGVGVGAAYHPAWGPTPVEASLIAYVCDSAVCDCSGTGQPLPQLCVRNGDASSVQWVASPPPSAIGKHVHTPSMEAIGGLPVLTWTQQDAAGVSRVHMAVRNVVGGQTQWQVTPWTTAGMGATVATDQDFRPNTLFAMGGGVLIDKRAGPGGTPGATERTHIQYLPSVPGEIARAYVFASAAFADQDPAANVIVEIVAKSMGVGQNANSMAILETPALPIQNEDGESTLAAS